MTHIDSLPPEILSCIFYALFECIKPQSILDQNVYRPPNLVNILLVSSHWNGVATSSPSLWSYIPVTNENGIGIERVTQLVKRDLLRSKEYPLDVVIKVDANLGNKLELLLEQVVRHTHRWRKLYVRALTAEAISILEWAHLPHLLGLAYVGSFGGLGLKLDTPRLERLTLHAVNSNSLTFGDPLTTLTHLRYTLTSNATQEFLKHLQHSQRTLTTLSIRCYIQLGTQLEVHSDYRAPGSSDTLKLSFPALTEYRVRFRRSWDWNAFNIGHLPHLRKLSIDCFSFRNDFPESTISSMPQLVTLDISANDPYSFETAATTLLAAAPNLERLCLFQTRQTTDTDQEKWIGPLVCGGQDSETVPCPRLVVLRLGKITIQRWDDLRKVGSRRPAFKTLSLDPGCWEQSGGETQDLTVLRQCFDIVVEDGPEF